MSQLWITRKNGEVHLTEVAPNFWREHVYYEGYNGSGSWFRRTSLDCQPRACEVYDINPKLREACRFALTW